MRAQARNIALTFIFMVSLLPFQNCRLKNGGSTTGNPFQIGVDLKFAAFETSSTMNEKSVAQYKPGSNFALDICMGDLYFKYYYSRNPDIYDPDRATSVGRVGPVQILKEGTSIGNFLLDDGEYNQIELNLYQTYDWTPCGFALRVTNEQGTFMSSQTIAINYQGQFTINAETHLVELPTQELANAMSEVNAQENGCDTNPSRPDCVACAQDSTGPSCLTIERLIVERGLGYIWGR
jgi:hypothetical protein